MKTRALFLILSLLVLSCTGQPEDSPRTSNPAYDYDVEERIRELGIELRTPPPPLASYIRTSRIGNIVFLSGHGPDLPEGGRVIGKVGRELTLEQGQEAARWAAISLLSSLRAEIGDLNKVVRIAKVTGMVNAVPEFTQHSQVINGFSDLMVEIFGDAGRHTRASVGMSSLPFNMAVEIEMIVEVSD